MTEDFKPDTFLLWLNEQDGPVPASQIEQWVNFPWENMNGVTCQLHDGEVAYFKRDLRRAANQRKLRAFSPKTHSERIRRQTNPRTID